MSITVPKSTLMPALLRASAVSAKKSTMPALANVLLVTVGGTLRVSATDLLLGVSSEVEASVKAPLATAVHAKDLAERVKAMPDGDVVLKLDKGNLAISSKAGARRYSLPTMSADDFPAVPQPGEGASVSLPAAVLGSLIEATSFAVSADETRAHLNAAKVEWEGKVIRMVATDGHRLAMADAVVANIGAMTMLVPQRSLGELRRLCDALKKDALLEVSVEGNSAHFKAEGVTLSTRLVDAEFPPYMQIIPRDKGHRILAPREALLGAIRAVSVAASERTGGVTLRLEKNGAEVVVSSESVESGAGRDEVPVTYEGPAKTIGISAKYLAEAIGAVTTENVALYAGAELSPVVVEPDGDSSIFGLVMPMRV